MVFLKLELSLKHNRCSFTTSRHGTTRSQNTCAEPQVAVARGNMVNFTGILMFSNTDPELLPQSSSSSLVLIRGLGVINTVKTAVRCGALQPLTKGTATMATSGVTCSLLLPGHWAGFQNCPGHYGVSNLFTPDSHFSVSLRKWPRPPSL